MRLLIVILSFFCFSSKANDSLKIKPRNFLIRIGAGQGVFILDPPLNTDYFQQSFDFGDSKHIELNINYCLLSRSRNKNWNSKFFLGLGMNIEQFPVNHYFHDYDASQSTPDWELHEFDTHLFSYLVTQCNYQGNISWMIRFKKVFLYQRIGVYYSTYINKKEYPYVEHVSGVHGIAGPGPATSINEYRSGTAKNYYKNKFNGGYSIGVGCKIKRFMPSVSVEGSTFYANFWYSQLKTQLNLMVEF